MFNITTFLDIRARENPDKVALIHPSRKITYTWKELHETVCNLSSGLIKWGVRDGDRVVLFLDSSPSYLIANFALWRIGAIVVPANVVYREEELRYVVEDSGAQIIITDVTGRTVAEKVATDLGLPKVIVSGSHGPDSLETLYASSPSVASHPGNPGDLCQIQYTSGTTGKPKGAMLTITGWIAAFDAERDALDLTNDDVYLGIYPMAHVGISWGMSVLKEGGTWVIMERFHLDQYLSLAEEYQVTVLAGMPPVIHSIMDHPGNTEYQLRTVRRIISGGGPMHAPTWRSFHSRFHIPIINAYGLSETVVLGAGTVIKPEHYPDADEFNSVGTPVGYTEVKIVDETDPSVTLPSEVPGEIALRGPGVALGYWRKPEETTAVFLPDGWFLTGDVGYIDKNGMLVITDRKKDMIIMSGWKIYPTEVETVLIQHPDISEVAIFGCPDEEKGEIPVAAVVLRNGCTLTHTDLISYAKEHLAGYKIPRKTIFVENLPRVGGWKLLRRQLREQYCML